MKTTQFLLAILATAALASALSCKCRRRLDACNGRHVVKATTPSGVEVCGIKETGDTACNLCECDNVGGVATCEVGEHQFFAFNKTAEVPEGAPAGYQVCGLEKELRAKCPPTGSLHNVTHCCGSESLGGVTGTCRFRTWSSYDALPEWADMTKFYKQSKIIFNTTLDIDNSKGSAYTFSFATSTPSYIVSYQGDNTPDVVGNDLFSGYAYAFQAPRQVIMPGSTFHWEDVKMFGDMEMVAYEPGSAMFESMKAYQIEEILMDYTFVVFQQSSGGSAQRTWHSASFCLTYEATFYGNPAVGY
eukprot:CAMPEP_0174890852 /NCGR_PEP_ID=MMETSP0167-20121228/5960_1 /TAXON_ID=38298 /ORGANISM="Rhodella maculata, Strain CCMP736" /LENGTH=301 /DNA_ID=CAMNT_0016128805 /DNA_START=31 /DNA_END=936 /DNA_ORIENTATION=+